MNELKKGIKSFYTLREKALRIKVRNRIANSGKEESRNPFTSQRHISRSRGEAKVLETWGLFHLGLSRFFLPSSKSLYVAENEHRHQFCGTFLASRRQATK